MALDNPHNKGLTKKAGSKLIQERYKSFINYLVDSGFNGTEAYCRAYRTTNRELAKSCASRLLANVNVIKLLEAELVKLNVDSLISKETIVAQVYSILPELKSEQVRARYHELLAKIGKLTENNPIINVDKAIFTTAIDDIVRKRCNSANTIKDNASIDNQPIDIIAGKQGKSI